MRKKLTGLIIILIVIYEVIVYQNYSKYGSPPGTDFDHWTGILGRLFAFSLFGFGPFLILIFVQFFFGSGKKWHKAQAISLALGVVFLLFAVVGEIFFRY